jgi:hypothetical protein
MVDIAHLVKHIIIFILGFGITFILFMFMSAVSMIKGKAQMRYSDNLKDATLVKAKHKNSEYILVNPTNFREALYLMVAGSWWYYVRKKKDDMLPKNKKAENIVMFTVLLILAILLITSFELMYVVITEEAPNHSH